MTYVITKPSRELFGQEYREIEDAYYNQIINAKNHLTNCAALEEKFDIVLENYYEFELTLLTTAIRGNIFRDHWKENFNFDRSTIDRRITNLLATQRMYLDHAQQSMRKSFGRSSEEAVNLETVIAKISNENLGFRLCEFLRNHILHFATPTHSIVYSHLHDKETKIPNIGTITIPYLNFSRLCEDKALQQPLKDQLQDLLDEKNSFDVRPLIRESIDGLGKINEYIRSSIQENIKDWEETYESVFSIINDEFTDKSLIGIAVGRLEGNDLTHDHYIGREIIDHRRKLIRKNISQNNMHLTFASNQTRPEHRLR